MIRILLVSHSNLAVSVLQTGKMICGRELISDIDIITITENKDGIKEFEKKCTKYYEKYKYDEFLILADLLGATPFNVCASVFYLTNHYIITGMNLPMFIDTVINRHNLSLRELAESVTDSAKKSIKMVRLNDETETYAQEDDEAFL